MSIEANEHAAMGHSEAKGSTGNAMGCFSDGHTPVNCARRAAGFWLGS